MEIVKNIAAIIGCILSFTSLITFCTKAGRKLIYQLVKSSTKELQEVNQQQNNTIDEIKNTIDIMNAQVDILCEKYHTFEEVLAQDCRNTIKNIYYKYHAIKKIPLYERKTADKTYEIYSSRFSRNTYAKLLYEEICKWEIDTITYPILEED